ncbi:hypothetical protein K439DRAFT_413004 [Ramaria rubella]|nr:hypothetical protein K439DRAFT_413004 [Ramaria rubella]
MQCVGVMADFDITRRSAIRSSVRRAEGGQRVRRGCFHGAWGWRGKRRARVGAPRAWMVSRGRRCASSEPQSHVMQLMDARTRIAISQWSAVSMGAHTRLQHSTLAFHCANEDGARPPWYLWTVVCWPLCQRPLSPWESLGPPLQAAGLPNVFPTLSTR